MCVFELCPSSLSSPVPPRSSVFFLVGLVFSFHDLFVSSLRLCHESKHFALRRLTHSFVLFCECLCSRGVAHRRGFHCVEKPKSMFLDVSSCLYWWNVAQAALIRFLISVVSCCWKVIIWPKYFALSPLANISTLNVISLWLLRIFVFPGWILSPTFSVLLLNSHNIFWSCSFEDAIRSTSSAYLMFVRQSWS